jgi:hypothetical protein
VGKIHGVDADKKALFHKKIPDTDINIPAADVKIPFVV